MPDTIYDEALSLVGSYQLTIFQMSKSQGPSYPVVIGIGVSLFGALCIAVFLIPILHARTEEVSTGSALPIEENRVLVRVPQGRKLSILRIDGVRGSVPIEVTWTPENGGQASTVTLSLADEQTMSFFGPGTFRVNPSRGGQIPTFAYRLEPVEEIAKPRSSRRRVDRGF